MPWFDAPDYWWARFLLQRGLALVYLIAFLASANQFRPLLGEDGLLPVPRFLERVGFMDAPSVFHWAYSDRLAGVLAWGGVGLSVLALVGVPEAVGTLASMAVWALLWVLYLSFVNVGQIFYGYGWESLLLEAGFLAVFLGGSGTASPEIVVWLFRWVLFRVMFGAGLIKLRGDACWRKLTCLDYHYETQPLPNPLSWFLHHGPRWLNRTGVAFTHFVQLVVPFLYFVPGPVSWAAGGLTLLFQGTLILSGNLSWLNWLTAVLALSCFGDAFLGGTLGLDALRGAGGFLGPEGWLGTVAGTVGAGGLLPVAASVGPPALPHQVAVWGLLLLVAALSVRPVRNLISRTQLMNASFEPLHLVNTYGAFGSVTRERPEIVIEGTDDPDAGADAEWRAYEFKGKPGDPSRRPPWVAPYHLRLDWQMWFAAMRPHRHPRWLVRLVAKLLEGDDAVLGLLASNPFPESPPRRVRARLFRYRFTDPAERRRSGRWWNRTEAGTYLPAVSLDHPGVRRVLSSRRGEP